MTDSFIDVSESCPVCYHKTTFGKSSAEAKPCDNCNVPLIAWIPFFKLTESGMMLKLAPEAAKNLIELYVEP
jgi:hypothetical protein